MRGFCFVLLLFVVSADAEADVPSLCASSERTVWSCQAGKKTYSLCASHDLSATAGYLQYRAGKNGRADFRYPATRLPAKGHFQFRLWPHGTALTFENGHYGYSIYEDIKGDTRIDVDKDGQAIATVDCSDATDTLTENRTIDLFKAVGVMK